MTTSAPTGCSRASSRPSALRTVWTLRLHSTESGRAKYTYSNTQCWRSVAGKARIDSGPASVMATISPGSTSRSNFASMRSSAHVSDATTQESASRPRLSGLKALRAEHVGHPAHGLLDVELLAVGGRDARGLLPAMLEGVETEVGDVGRFRMIPDAEHATFVVELVVTPRDVQSPSSTRAGARGDRRRQPWSHHARS